MLPLAHERNEQRTSPTASDDYTEWYSGCRLQLFYYVHAAGARRMARHLTEPAPAMALVEGGCLKIDCQQLLPEPLAQQLREPPR